MKREISLLILVALGGCAVEQGPEAAVVSGGPMEMPVMQQADAADYFAGVLPDELADGMVATLDRTPFDARLVAELYAYGDATPGDARPWLLLAGDALRTEDWARAVYEYGRAIEADPQVLTFRGVLDDLVFVASLEGTAGDEARELITDVYGADAMPAVDAALDEMHARGDRDRAYRLGELRKAIAG